MAPHVRGLTEGLNTAYRRTGRYRGRLTGGVSGNVKLRFAQYDMLRDEGRALAVARAIVAGKIATMRGYLLRVGRRSGRTAGQERSLASLRACAERLDEAATLDQARGCEGSATAAYFRCFNDFLLVEGFRFDGRNRRPPLDPVNALLSFGYTILANLVEAAVNVVGLDPYVGALHALETNRPSLVCDLEEEFRVPVVDRLVVAALNKRVLQVDDFRHTAPWEGRGGHGRTLADMAPHVRGLTEGINTAYRHQHRGRVRGETFLRPRPSTARRGRTHEETTRLEGARRGARAPRGLRAPRAPLRRRAEGGGPGGGPGRGPRGRAHASRIACMNPRKLT
jgi:CRISPR-associated endonuclease Cas1